MLVMVVVSPGVLYAPFDFTNPALCSARAHVPSRGRSGGPRVGSRRAVRATRADRLRHKDRQKIPSRHLCGTCRGARFQRPFETLSLAGMRHALFVTRPGEQASCARIPRPSGLDGHVLYVPLTRSPIFTLRVSAMILSVWMVTFDSPRSTSPT